MTNSEIISKLESDAIFALGFAVDNNASGVVISLKNNGYNLPATLTSDEDKKVWAFNTLKNLLNTNKQKCIDIVSAVPYNKDATNYTAGFNDYFLRTQSADTVTAQQRFDINALLGGLGSGLTTYTAIAGASDSSSTMSEAERIAAAAEADRLAAEKKKRTTNIIIGVVVGIVVIVIVVSILRKKAKA